MCEMLTNEDCELSGFDLSQSMIDTARVKAKRKKLNIRYECQDAASFEMGETYDAAYSFFDSLNYITDTDQLRSAIKQVAKHLRPGGSFIFDLNTAYAFEADLFTQEDMKEKSKVRYKWVSDWNPETRIIKVQMRFWYEGDEYEEVHIQRAHTDEEIRSYLEEAGFQDTQAFHSYSLNKPRAKSDRIHYATRLG